jgi:hypothetical protein
VSERWVGSLALALSRPLALARCLARARSGRRRPQPPPPSPAPPFSHLCGGGLAAIVREREARHVEERRGLERRLRLRAVEVGAVVALGGGQVCNQ